jgi:hypothetical protein
MPDLSWRNDGKLDRPAWRDVVTMAVNDRSSGGSPIPIHQPDHSVSIMEFGHAGLSGAPMLSALLCASAGLLMLGIFTDWEYGAMFIGLGLLLLAFTTLGTLVTTVTMDAARVLTLRHHVLRITVFVRRYPPGDFRRLELRTIPIRVAPGVRQRYSHALWVIHRHGAQPVHQSEQIEVLELPARTFSRETDCELVHIDPRTSAV